jgi:hypothetical protein
MRIVICFTPVDEENSLLYLRFYQRVVRVPGVRKIFDWGSLLMGWIITNQDKRVVLTQMPKKTDLNMGEHLVAGDHPIVLYRRRRSELIQSAKSAIPV